MTYGFHAKHSLFKIFIVYSHVQQQHFRVRYYKRYHKQNDKNCDANVQTEVNEVFAVPNYPNIQQSDQKPEAGIC